MNKIIIALSILTLLTLSISCNENGLDLNPLSEGSSETWYSNDTELRSSLNYLYSGEFWNPDPDALYYDFGGRADAWSDDWSNRNNLSTIAGGTINGETGMISTFWSRYYRAVAASNLFLEKIEVNKNVVSEETYGKYTAEARFARASMYANLIFYWGDVPYFEQTLSIDDAFAMGRVDKKEILQKIYADYDYAASKLPESYSGTKYATKGAALALKARIALYMGDWQTARDAAKACIDLDTYQLYPSFKELFLSKTKQTSEAIFSLPSSDKLGRWQDNYWMNPENARHISPRSNGGNMYVWPSLDLFYSFLCTDGLPVDESPLFDPQNPFKNRDPRCTETIVEFGTEHGGVIYQPHPDSLETLNVVTGTRIRNKESLGVDQYASWNGLSWKKGYDSDWYDDFIVSKEHIIIRYAEILMIYAEAKIELNEIDQSVLDALNKVRSRAYGVKYTDTSFYPEITATDQQSLRQTLRIERRMEFAFEGRYRHADIIRWRLAEKVLNKKMYAMLDLKGLRERIVEKGLWFLPEAPSIDEDGVPDFSSLEVNNYLRVIAVRSFDKSRHYLWPLPTKEILINKNIKQNPGY